MKKMQFGVVGCGAIAKAHIEAFKEHDAQCAGVADNNPEAAKKFAAELGGARICKDYRELVDAVKPDLISICTPPVAHEETAVYALQQGVHVLCEKPLAYDIQAARRVRDAAEKSRALLMPAFRHRFMYANIMLRDIAASGEIGDIVLFNNIFCGPSFAMETKWFTKKAVAGGGCLLDTNSHSVDLFRFIVGEIAEQRALMHRHFKTTDVEDAGVLVVKSDKGALGVMASSFVAGSGSAFIEITGTKGKMRYDYTDREKVLVRLAGDKDWTARPVKQSNGFAEEISHFLGAIEGKHKLSCTVVDGVRVMEVICGVY
ncbi:MAG: Gfo/Idh/MocA family oxidoreductase [Kiritimatiellae bacterium]|nr:Gfo/Idh/MocA family oxidoreductase [Kiritimatiellia bacterium]